MYTRGKSAAGSQRRRKPIGPTAHVALDYGFTAAEFLAPTVFHLHGAARKLCFILGAMRGAINALTDHPSGVKRVIPFQVHGKLETPFLPAVSVLPRVTGVLGERNARRFFIPYFRLAAANYSLTDDNACEPPKHVSSNNGHPKPRGGRQDAACALQLSHGKAKRNET